MDGLCKVEYLSKLLSSPDLSPHEGKRVLVASVDFLGIESMIWEGPFRLLDIAFHVIVTFKTMYNT